MNSSSASDACVNVRVCRAKFVPQPKSALRLALAGLRRAALAPLALTLLAPLAVFAQSNAAPARVTAEISESSLTTLRGNTHPLARPQYDQGRVAPSLKLERMTMLFQQTAAQKSDLEALLAAQQNPTSPSFHQWLTPAQYGQRFGIAQADLDKVTAWLQAHGFAIVETPKSKNFIAFEGTAAQVERAFHVEIHNYATSEHKFYGNSGDPSVPAALGSIVAGFRGLNNYQLKPRSVKQNPMSGIPQPEFTSSISGNHYVAPGDFAVIYDLNPLYSASTAIDGTGQSIVVVGQSNVVLADIAAFRTAAGLPAKAPTVTLVPSSTDPGVQNGGDEQESSIDIEWSGAVAKNATIKFVYSGNGAFDALQYSVSNNLAPIISISYGSCEASIPTSEIDALAAIAQQANAQGVTIISSSGDGGATDCDGDLGNYPAVLGLNVDVPASIPYVTAVGGTEFNEGTGTYWKAVTNPPGTDVITSALSYIPEIVWNDSLASQGTQQPQLVSGGGGVSTIFGKPTWQTGTGVPADGFRDVPDISMNASTSNDSYLTCLQFVPKASTTGTFVSSCVNGTFRYTDTSVQLYGGTSFGAPTFAGILALINQKTASAGQGNINYILYPLAASSSTAFHDITTGNNASPCVLGSQNCPNGGSIGYNAGTGYDQATGLGSIDGTNMANAWSSISTGAGSTPTLSSISPTSTAAGSTNFTLTATGSNFATNAQILWNGSTAGVTMQSGGTATTIKATISTSLVAYGTVVPIAVTDDASKAGESSTTQTFTVNGTPPLNDNIANAIAITTSSFTSTVDSSAATTEATDPNPLCALIGASPSTNARTKTVWWTLTAVSNGTVNLNTIGSVYDTTLSVWTGAPGSLSNVACNDDISNGQITQSALSFATVSGTKYYIMVAPYGPPDTGSDLLGGKTVLNVTNANPSPLSASPNSQTVAAGNSATYMITDASASSYPLTCTGLPKGATCGSVTVSANSTASLVISTTSRTASVPPPGANRPMRWRPYIGALSFLAVFICILWGTGKRRVTSLVPLGTMALFLVLVAVGCGSSGSGGGGVTTNPNGTPAGTYNITVTGSGSVSTTVTLIIT